ncbi:hypothetical protein MKW94_025429 [Papaver nudicaule]|uniref:Uncharacterized protein n=1 Tax=Papaver nudicaule TaxID=74823 RepID=A0AA41RX74_PAPNU|nr:hypothetical protein [Papaver nudicaule]
MDLGCMDLGCIEKKSNETSVDFQRRRSGSDSDEFVTASSKFGKSKPSKEAGQSTLNSVNKSTSQIRKSYRKTSPLNWFPRKKTESYLKRKIRLLQEVGGMNSTLDETLCDSKTHYSRVLQEKIAAKEAARKAMEARKAALVEASWCRILRAARIQNKEAESLLRKAEKTVEEAFEAAAAMRVIMYDKPDCPQKACEIESSNIEGSTTHTVTASFETAFDVDKEVAAAVKIACIRLANCPSLNKNEFRDLLRKINQNPEMIEADQEVCKLSAECESDSGLDLDTESLKDDLAAEVSNRRMLDTKRKCMDRGLLDINHSIKLVDVMLERLQRLRDDELASLATIVATCGLNAALLEVENSKLHGQESGSEYTLGFANVESLKNRNMRRQVESKIPSLDKVLVKHMSRLEREVQEAKNTRKNKAEGGTEDKTEGSENRADCLNINASSSNAVPELGSMFVKHVSKLEKSIQEAKKNSGIASDYESKQLRNPDASDLPSLDKFLVKRVSRLEREVQEAKKVGKDKPKKSEEKTVVSNNKTGEELGEFRKLRDKQQMEEVPSLDNFLVKHVSKLEREVQEAKIASKTNPVGTNTAADAPTLMGSSQEIASSCEEEKQVGKENIDSNRCDEISDETVKEKVEMEIREQQSLKPVVQHENSLKSSEQSPMQTKNMSRLERAKLETLEAFSCEGGNMPYSLDAILTKPVHRLEREKLQASAWGSVIQKNQNKQGGAVASDSEGLDKVLVKHVSRLEKEKLAAVGQEEVMRVKKRDMNYEKSVDGLDQMVKHQSRLEKEKFAAALNSGDQTKHSEVRRKAMERELQDAWGGLSLGNSVRPHVSRLEREKAAWMKADEEELANHA